MSKKVKILTIVMLLVVCVSMFSACTLQYGQPDKLDIANQSVGMRIWIGLQVAFLGIVTVFAVLVILILFIILLKYLMMGINKLGEKMAESKNKKNQAQPVVTIEDKSIVPNDGASEDEIVAAITAALMAYYDAEQKIVYESNVKFRVRSIKEIK